MPELPGQEDELPGLPDIEDVEPMAGPLNLVLKNVEIIEESEGDLDEIAEDGEPGLGQGGVPPQGASSSSFGGPKPAPPMAQVNKKALKLIGPHTVKLNGGHVIRGQFIAGNKKSKKPIDVLSEVWVAPSQAQRVKITKEFADREAKRDADL